MLGQSMFSAPSWGTWVSLGGGEGGVEGRRGHSFLGSKELARSGTARHLGALPRQYLLTSFSPN